jgi:hypothetical protein
MRAAALAPPSGYRDGNGTDVGDYHNRSNNTNLWSSTEASSGNAWRRNLNYGNTTVNRNDNVVSHGFSVRCAKNWKRSRKYEAGSMRMLLASYFPLLASYFLLLTSYFMATYDNLPVYKTAYDLLLEIFQFTKDFSRQYKYTIGQDLKLETTQLIKRIFQANSTFQYRKQYIQYAREHTETIRLYLRLLKDMKQINVNKFISLNEKVESISKQLARWGGGK